jgi:hypothetical protein
MINRNIATLLLLAISSLLFSQQEYYYTIDLINVKKDMVKVTLTPPKMSKEEVMFIMPEVVPGTYSTENFGRFLSRFSAYDINGKKLKVKQKEINRFYIKGASALAKVEYTSMIRGTIRMLSTSFFSRAVPILKSVAILY